MSGCAIAQGAASRVVAAAKESDDIIVAAYTGEEKITQVRLPSSCVTALGLAANDTQSLDETLDFAASAFLCRAGIESRLADGTLYIEGDAA